MVGNENEPNGHRAGETNGVARIFKDTETVFVGLTHLANLDVHSTNGNGHGNIPAIELLNFFKKKRKKEKKKAKKG